MLNGSSIIFLNHKILKTKPYLLFCSPTGNMLTSLFFFGTVLCSLKASGYAVALQASELFQYEGEISYENNYGTIREISMSRIRCAAKCLEDLSCNAVELCATPSGQTCRLSKGWKNTGCTLSQFRCKRFQIVSTI